MTGGPSDVLSAGFVACEPENAIRPKIRALSHSLRNRRQEFPTPTEKDFLQIVAANPGNIRNLLRFLHTDHTHPPEVRRRTAPAKRTKYPYRRAEISEAMKKILIPVLLSALLILTVPACRHTRQSPVRMGSAPEIPAAADSHNSRNALDWEGTYSGTLPCPDGGTATVRLTLSGSGYRLHTLCGNGETEETAGEFVWDTTGGIITLHGEVFPSAYRVGENRLIPAEPNGSPLGLPDLEKEVH